MRTTTRLRSLLLVLALSACAGERAAPANPDPATNTYAAPLGVDIVAMTRTPSGLYYRDTQPGTGQEATTGRRVTVHYTGWLPDGTKFDSSRDAGDPFRFTLGRGEVIEGWDEGVAGMRVGGKRTLVIPPSLGYGEDGAGPIPPNSVLVFDVELLDVSGS